MVFSLYATFWFSTPLLFVPTLTPKISLHPTLYFLSISLSRIRNQSSNSENYLFNIQPSHDLTISSMPLTQRKILIRKLLRRWIQQWMRVHATIMRFNTMMWMCKVTWLDESESESPVVNQKSTTPFPPCPLRREIEHLFDGVTVIGCYLLSWRDFDFWESLSSHIPVQLM